METIQGVRVSNELGVNGETVQIIQPVDVDALRCDLEAVYNQGIRSCAVVLVHAYAYPKHEIMCGQIAREIGFTHVSLSHEIMQMVRLVPRGQTTAVDAYLTPIIHEYLRNFRKGFRNHLEVFSFFSFCIHMSILYLV